MFRSAIRRPGYISQTAIQRFALSSSGRAGPLSSIAQAGKTRSPVVLRSSVSRLLATRFYSSEAVAEKTQATDDDQPTTAPGPITRFPDLPKLGVHPVLVRSIVEGMKYENMTEVQTMTINSALAGRDLVAQAKTGTGKTLAFLVPIVQRILEAEPSLAEAPARRHKARPDDIRAIILSPTRELAEQIGVEAKKLTRGTGVIVQTAVGGTRKNEMLYRTQREGCHLLVATPGRLQDLLSDPDSGIRAPKLAAFVLDEADRMLDVGFSEAIADIQGLLPSPRDVERQTLLFSATIPRDVVHLAKSMVNRNNFEFVQTIKADDTPTHEKVPQHVVALKGYENFLPSFLELAHRAVQEDQSGNSATPFKAIVFFNNTSTVQFAHEVLRRSSLYNKIPIFDIHSKLTQAQRTRSAETFRRSKSAVLLSSDVTARGMDFPNVSHVVQFGLPNDRDSYIHRIGRTGRAQKSGEAWIFLTEGEIAEARLRLQDLPIKPNNSLAAPQHSIGEQTPPSEVASFFDEIAEGSRRAQSLFSSVYSAMLGQKQGRRFRVEDMAELLRDWSIKGVGLEKPPSISPSSAAKRGLTRIPGINIGYDDAPRSSRTPGGRFGGRDLRDPFGDEFGEARNENSSRSAPREGRGRGFGDRDFGGNRGSKRNGGFGGNRNSRRDESFSRDGGFGRERRGSF